MGGDNCWMTRYAPLRQVTERADLCASGSGLRRSARVWAKTDTVVCHRVIGDLARPLHGFCYSAARPLLRPGQPHLLEKRREFVLANVP